MLGCRDKRGAEPRLHPRAVPLRNPWDCLGTPRGTPGPFWGCNLRPLGRKPGPGKAHRGTSPGLPGVRRACRGGCSAALPGPPGPGHEEGGGGTVAGCHFSAPPPAPSIFLPAAGGVGPVPVPAASAPAAPACSPAAAPPHTPSRGAASRHEELQDGAGGQRAGAGDAQHRAAHPLSHQLRLAQEGQHLRRAPRRRPGGAPHVHVPRGIQVRARLRMAATARHDAGAGGRPHPLLDWHRESPKALGGKAPGRPRGPGDGSSLTALLPALGGLREAGGPSSAGPPGRA